MKKFIFLVISVLVFNAYSYSQTSWVRVTDSIPNMTVMSMQFTSVNTGFASCSYGTTSPGAFLRTTNAGMNWQVTQFPNYSADAISFLNDNTGYMSCWYPGYSNIFKTTNGGITWVRKDSSILSNFIVKFYDYNTGMIAAKYGYSRKTTDGGERWTNLTKTFWREPQSLCCLNENTWLVADGGTDLYKTTDGGNSWAKISFPDMPLKSLYFINSTTGYSAASTNYPFMGKFYKTTNSGNNWTLICSIASLYVTSNLTFVNENTGYICGTGVAGEVLRTTNGGYNWSMQSPRTTYSFFHAVYFINAWTGFVGDADGIIYKTTNGGSVFVNNISTEIPKAYSLSQNYPNPFNPATTIKFAIPKSSLVKITVYNLLGKEIETVVNEYLQAGTYQTQWDATKYSSGMYFYRITAGNFTNSKKMLLIK